MLSLNSLAIRIHDTASNHGFWDEERNMGEMIALVHSELSEALEEHRAGKPNVYFKCTECGLEVAEPPGPEIAHRPIRTPGKFWGVVWAKMRGFTVDTVECDGTQWKPEGAAVEFADTLIRILDTMASLGVDIDHVVETKMRYNDGRPYKHGKAY